MPMIEVICARCGGTAQIEEGRQAMCPYCGRPLTSGPAESGAAFAQAVQFAEPPDSMQTAQNIALQKPAAAPPVQTAVQQNPAAVPLAQPVVPQQNPAAVQPVSGRGAAFVQSAVNPAGGASAANPVYAKRRRNNWHFLNAGLYAIQSAVAALAILFDHHCRDMLHERMMLGWLAAMVLFPAISTALRPDDCYTEKAPFPKHRALLFMALLLLGLTSFIPGAVAETIIDLLIDMIR